MTVKLAKRRCMPLGIALILCAAGSAAGAQSGIIISAATCDDAWFAENNTSCTAEQRARAGERKRAEQRDEQRRNAENLAEKRRKDALVAAEVGKMGTHREAEARRLVEMREAAERARGQPVGPATPVKPTIKCEQRTVAGSMDSRPDGASLLFTGFKTRPAAETSLRQKVSRGCTAQTGAAGASVSNMSCADEAGRWVCNARFACSSSATGNCSNSQ